jgi:predicted nucleotide-binding protein
LFKWNTPTLSELGSKVQTILGIQESQAGLNAFIVHGHDDAAKLEVKNYLQNSLHIPEPIILHEQPNLGRTIIEKFEGYAQDVQLAFIILTPDDKSSSSDSTNEEKRCARQNVILELGYFLGTLGRSSGRIILLFKGPLELPSDIQGLIYIDISHGIEAAGEQIRRELKDVLK